MAQANGIPTGMFGVVTPKLAREILDVLEIKRLSVLEDEQMRMLTLYGSLSTSKDMRKRIGHLYGDHELDHLTGVNKTKFETTEKGSTGMASFIELARAVAKKNNVDYKVVE